MEYTDPPIRPESETPLEPELETPFTTTQEDTLVTELTGIVKWIHATPENCSRLECRAVIGGWDNDGSDLWVIRTVYECEMLPGKLNYGRKEAYVAYGNQEIRIDQFEVCCIPRDRVQWVECSRGRVAPNAVVGGRTKCGETLYVGKALQDRSMCPGMVQPSLGALRFSYDSKVYCHQFYEVLCVAW